MHWGSRQAGSGRDRRRMSVEVVHAKHLSSPPTLDFSRNHIKLTPVKDLTQEAYWTPRRNCLFFTLNDCLVFRPFRPFIACSMCFVSITASSGLAGDRIGHLIH